MSEAHKRAARQIARSFAKVLGLPDISTPFRIAEDINKVRDLIDQAVDDGTLVSGRVVSAKYDQDNDITTVRAEIQPVQPLDHIEIHLVVGETKSDV